jgi:CheY-like chemotaxis protein
MSAANSGSAGSLSGLKVLVVDDDPNAREALVEVCLFLGARATPASGAADARLVLRYLRPDIILSDVSMPDEDGCRFIAALRRDEAARGGTPATVAAIAVTGQFGEADRARALAAGFQAVLPKPYDIAAIRDAVLGLVGDRRSVAGLG